jgi:hypothetical protein
MVGLTQFLIASQAISFGEILFLTAGGCIGFALMFATLSTLVAMISDDAWFLSTIVFLFFIAELAIAIWIIQQVSITYGG